MSPRRYFIAIVTISLGLVVAAWILAWWLEPLYGDLTRIGGYAERDYGWNAPMEEFHPLLATWGETYDHPVDVLVIGDSFANLRPPQQWQNWLAARTGWRIHTLDKHKVVLGDLIASRTYRLAPPRLVIWNNIERDLKDEYGKGSQQCASNSVTARLSPMKLHPLGISALNVMRPTDLWAVNPGFARNWLWKTLLRKANIRGSEALLLQLKRTDLFSSRTSGDLLVYRNELQKGNWTDVELDRIRCSYSEFAALFEENGTTRFVTAIAPDKSSAYRPWLRNPSDVPPSRLPALLDDFPVPDARLDGAIADAITRGISDVYMPNDTHWGSAGQKVAADAILKLLIKEGLSHEQF